MPVKVMEAKAVPVSESTDYVATLKSRDSAVIMPQVEGLITQIYVPCSWQEVHAGGAASPAAYRSAPAAQVIRPKNTEPSPRPMD